MPEKVNFDQLAGSYDSMRGGAERGNRSALALTPHLVPGAVLEVGIGTGAVAEGIRDSGHDVYGVDVEADRVAAARAIAHRYRSLVVLKGNGSVIAAPEGKFWINPSGNPGMASAGMGDALSGMIAALIAQGAEPLHALLAGVYLHGAAADELVAAGTGPIGITASEVIDSARALLNRRT